MALTIFRKYPETGESTSEVWHIGSEEPEMDDNDEYVVSVKANGEELNKVLNEIKGIPQAEGRPVVTWFGDHARFIVANLNY